MCGIAGVLDPDRATSAPELRLRAERMARRLTHRGPDGAGSWTDQEAGIALGFRRLAILDLSPAGDQPMASTTGRWVVVYNGELYNHRSLRRALGREGVAFRGSSDTEVLVAAIERWGVHTALERSNGMFAFAAWDRAERRLTLARDRLGEKPLYYGWAGRHFVFASEIAALRAIDDFPTGVSADAVAAYVRLTHVPSPLTIFEAARSLTPGSMLVVEGGVRPGTWPEPHRWWTVDQAIGDARRKPFHGDRTTAEEALAELLRDAVASRLDSDVPLGCFLSGGYDSSLVAALAATSSSEPTRTFTVRMPDLGLDESADAERVAQHLGTVHETVDMSVAEALDLVPRLPEMYGEPFGDPSALPTALVCAAARGCVTVALGGDGGDEMFAGYNRYVLGGPLWRRSRRVPRPIRRVAARLALAPSPGAIDWLAARVPGGPRVRNVGDKVQKVGRLLRADDAESFEAALVEEWDPVALLVDPPKAVRGRADVDGDLVAAMIQRDLRSTLPDQMLVKVDRASMAAGLEVRSPLVDHRFVSFVWSTPLGWHVGERRGKRLLRDVLTRFVPRELIDRPKMGFDPPVGSWLRRELRPWAEDLLRIGSLEETGLRRDVVRTTWEEHQRGVRNHDYALWTVLQLLAWVRSV